MSLINEALKKAQKMRNEPQAGANPYAPPAPPAPLPAPVPLERTAKSGTQTTGFSGRSVVLIAGGAGLLACICILTTVIVLRKPASDTGTGPSASSAVVAAVSQPAAPIQQSAPRVSAPTPSSPPAIVATQSAVELAPAEPASAPVSRSAPTSTAAVPSQSVAQSPSSKVPDAVRVVQSVANSTPVRVQAETPVISMPLVNAPKVAQVAAPVAEQALVVSPSAVSTVSPIQLAPLPKEQPMIQLPSSIGPAPVVHEDASLEQAAQQFVSKTRISGIRPGIKVLINGRAYRPNDLVESILNLRLVEIGQDQLIFVDQNGKRYRRGL